MKFVKIWPVDGVVRMNAVGRSHPGRVRDKNEDAYRIDLDYGLLVLADGLGGHPYGEIASELAVQAVQRFFRGAHPELHPFPELLLPEAIFFAHAALKDAVCENPKLEGMGTTLLVAWILAGSNKVRLSHIGDSRAYLLQSAKLEQLTEDHTLLTQAMKTGMASSWVEKNLPSAHVLVQAVGQGEVLKPSSLEIHLERGDRLLLCTDGLTNELAPEDIEAILSHSNSLEDACQGLVQATLQSGANDNVTVIVAGES
jgi:serine/threonine protein phosphatase PrpC